jgi:hypothetical protein
MSTGSEGDIHEINVQGIVEGDFSLPEPQGLVDMVFLDLTNDHLHGSAKSYRFLQGDDNVQGGIAGKWVAIDWMKPELRTGAVEEFGGG